MFSGKPIILDHGRHSRRMMTRKKVKDFKMPGLFQKRVFTAAILFVFFAITAFTLTLRMQTVVVYDGEAISKIQTLSSDHHEILAQAGVTLSADDAFESFVQDGKLLSVTVSRAFDVYICADGITLSVKMHSGTVEDALAKSGIYLSEDDLLCTPVDAPVFAGLSVDITRVNYGYIQQEHSLPYESTTEYSTSLEKGKTKTLTAGVDGIKVVTLLQRFEDGKVIKEVPVKEEVVREPVAEKKLIGTRDAVVPAAAVPKAISPSKVILSAIANAYSKLSPVSDIEFDENGIPRHYKQLITGKASAYYENPATNSTSTGRVPMAGHVAVNPKQIPYGTKLWIRTANGQFIYGHAIAADTGGFASKGRITVDLFLNSTAECYAFGIRDVEIYVLE